MVDVDDARRHLTNHEQLYWEVGFRIRKETITFPILGFIHIAGDQVEYRVTISDIVPFEPAHYENPLLATKVKPEPWVQEWRENIRGVRSRPWRNTLVMTQIDPFSYETKNFVLETGGLVKNPPHGYARVFPPNQLAASSSVARPVTLAERNLEDFIVQQLDEIEPGLSLVNRQLSTPAGRLDLLCRDIKGDYVVVELKKSYGSDQVVGQTLRYMGWVMDKYPKQRVRGIVIVGKKDEQLNYAIKAAHGIEAKEFKISVV